MILSYEDILIFREFCKLKSGESMSSWQLMKKIYRDGNDKEHMNILSKINKLAKYGFFTISQNGNNHKTYGLVSDKVSLKKINYPDRNAESICLIYQGKWQSIEI